MRAHDTITTLSAIFPRVWEATNAFSLNTLKCSVDDDDDDNADISLNFAKPMMGERDVTNLIAFPGKDGRRALVSLPRYLIQCSLHLPAPYYICPRIFEAESRLRFARIEITESRVIKAFLAHSGRGSFCARAR